MPDYAIPVVLVLVTLLLGAWREQRSNNSRDARLLAALGVGASLASSAFWLG